jgi:membrane associated rhomboid family serine protease
MSAPGRPAGASWVTAAAVIVAFVTVLYVIEAVDYVLGSRLDLFGIEPREADGLDGVLFAPLLHAGWVHLSANTVPLLALGFLILLSGVARWAAVTGIVWLVGGLGTWLTGGPNSLHLGASVLVFGWLVYLILRGVFSRRPGQVLLGVVVLFFYGGALWGVLPIQPGVSWQGHLFGAVGGAVAARWLAGRDARTPGHRARRI